MQILITVGAVVLSLVFAGIIAALYAYIRLGIPRPLTGLLISALGALSTLFLVVVTFATFVENQLLKIKEQRRPLVSEELAEVALPLTEILEDNRSNITDSSVRWDKIIIPEDEEFISPSGRGLEPLYPRSDIDTVVFNRYMSRNPKIAERIEEHDRRLRKLTDAGRHLVENFQAPIRQYIDQHELTSKTSNVSEPLLASLILDQRGDLQNHTHEELWNKHREGLRSAVENEYRQSLHGFYMSKYIYVKRAHRLENEIEAAREHTQREYKIPLHD